MYKRTATGWMKHLDFILCDVMVLLVSFAVAYVLRFGALQGVHWKPYTGYTVILITMDLLACIMLNPMHNVLKRGYYQEFLATFKHAATVFALIAVYLFTVKEGIIYSRFVLFVTVILHMLLGYGFRVLYKRMLQRHLRNEKQRSVLVIAPENMVTSIIRRLKNNTNNMMHVAGVVLTDCEANGHKEIEGIPVVADIENAAEYVCREWIDEVFVESSDAKNKLLALCDDFRTMGIVIHENISIERHLDQKQFIENLGGFLVLTSSVNYATPFQALVKRSMDIAGGLIGCAATLIIMAFIGPMIKRASPGPILYSQERVGKNGRKFKFYKIRSMHLDADERKKEYMSQNRVADGMMFKLDFDPRIIGNEILSDGTKKKGIGQFIRDTSLDEFPQFFNVLRGDMSLVGTRPPTIDEWEKYSLHHRARLAMKPGITGMWQVSGRSSITDFEEVVKLDTQYILNWDIGLDIRILLQTVQAVLKKRGAM